TDKASKPDGNSIRARYHSSLPAAKSIHDGFRHRQTTPAISNGLTGLTRYSSNPAAIAFWRSDSKARAVTAITHRFRKRGFERTVLMNSYPSRPGSIISAMTAEKFPVGSAARRIEAFSKSRHENSLSSEMRRSSRVSS